MMYMNGNDTEKHKLVEKRYLLPFILVTSLFALWGFANDITNPMVAAFQTLMELPASEAALVQFAFYGGYATMAVPAALFARRCGYKGGILLGLGFYALGAFLFIPAAHYQMFSFFCISLYILTFGLAFLETIANPLILSLGAKETATRRLNLAQAFNPMGSLMGMAVASFLVLPSLVSDFRDSAHNGIYDAIIKGKAVVVENADADKKSVQACDWTWVWNAKYNEQQKNDVIALSNKDVQAFVGKCAVTGVGMASLENEAEKLLLAKNSTVPLSFSEEEKNAVRLHDLAVIRNPYVALGLVVAFVFAVFLLTKIPETRSMNRKESDNIRTFGRLWKNNTFRYGVVAQVFYVAAQIMVWTFIIQYADNLGIDKATAQNYNICAMGMFLCSRFVSTFLMRFFSSRTMLAIFGACALCMSLGAVLFVGMPGLYCLVAISFFMSLMFPTIYGIALENVDKEDTALGAALLVMAIVGGALMPPLQGAVIDLESVAGMPAVNISFLLPMFCFFVVMLYGIYARKALK